MAMRIGGGVALLILVVGGVAWADSKILGGMPEYHMEAPGPGDPRPPCGSSADFAAASLDSDDQRPLLDTNPLSEVPEYLWWYGCSPTSGGMMVGYWDGRPGFGNLYDGDASIWSGDGSQGTRSMVARTAHIVSGTENGYKYGDWHNSASYPSHEANPNCIADFMKTVNGGSYANNITAGLEAYCEWDNPATPINESYEATATNIAVPFYGGSFTYYKLKDEIDAGRPVILDLICYTGYQWVGHSTVAYGYQDNMFQARVSTGGAYVDIVVGGFAVMDTWMNGTAQSEWVNWNWNIFGPVIDGNGVEWWPFIEFLGGSWYYTGGAVGPYDWMVADAVTLDVVPEPATLGLLVLGGLALLAQRRRK